MAEFPDLVLKGVVKFVLQSANPERVCRQPGSTIVLKNFEDLFARSKGVKKRRDSSDIHGVSPQPQQVTRDPIQLRQNDSRRLCACRRLYADQLFNCQTITKAIRDSRNVIHAVDVRSEHHISAVLSDLLDAPVEVADDALDISHPLPIKL
jgi:hypothetical protein